MRLRRRGLFTNYLGISY